MLQENIEKTIKKRDKKKGFEIILNNEEHCLNDNVQFSFGSIDDKRFPKSIYINSTFWFELKKENILENFDTDSSFNRYFRKSMNDIFKKLIIQKINESDLWINKQDSIYYFDVPNNIFYSNKRCFCSIELTLYTNNYNGDKTEFDFDSKNNLYKSIFDIVKVISSSDFFNECLYYSIHKRKK